MAETPKGIKVEYNAEGADLYVNYEGLEALRDNTTRPYSQYFADLITDIDTLQAQEFDPAPEQDPLPGL